MNFWKPALKLVMYKIITTTALSVLLLSSCALIFPEQRAVKMLRAQAAELRSQKAAKDQRLAELRKDVSKLRSKLNAQRARAAESRSNADYAELQRLTDELNHKQAILNQAIKDLNNTY